MLVNKTQNRIKKALRSKLGESIMEALVSMMILGILMTTVVSIIRFSMVMTGRSLTDATGTQEAFNELILTTTGVSDELVFTITEIIPPSGATGTFSGTAKHNVYVDIVGDLNATAFIPIP